MSNISLVVVTIRQSTHLVNMNVMVVEVADTVDGGGLG